MTVIDIDGELIKWLPKELKIGSDTFSLAGKWQHAKERSGHDPLYGTIEPIAIVPTRVHRTPRYVTKLVDRTEAKTYVNGTSIYQVTYRVIDSITSITGTKGGVAHTFVQDVDYKKVKTAGYATFDAIEWLDGGNKPDNNTSFTINYKSKMLTEHRDAWHRVTYALQICAKEVPAGGGISRTYPKTALVNMLGQALSNWLLLRTGQPLGSPRIPRLAFGRHEDFGPIAVAEGETLAIYEVHIVLRLQADAVGDDVYIIGRTQYTLDATLL